MPCYLEQQVTVSLPHTDHEILQQALTQLGWSFEGDQDRLVIAIRWFRVTEPSLTMAAAPPDVGPVAARALPMRMRPVGDGANGRAEVIRLHRSVALDGQYRWN